MSDQLSIKVNIAGEILPMTIDRKDEERIRKVASDINEKIKFFQNNYAVKDNKRVLAMVALQIGVQLSESSKAPSVNNDVNEKLIELNELLDDLVK